MTLEKPARTARQAFSYVSPWSRLSATGTSTSSAMARTSGAMYSGVACAFICRGEMSTMTGEPSSAAALTMARACSKSTQLMAMTA